MTIPALNSIIDIQANTADPDKLVTVYGAAVALGVDPRELWQAVKANQLPTTPQATPGASPLIRLSDVEAWHKSKDTE